MQISTICLTIDGVICTKKIYNLYSYHQRVNFKPKLGITEKYERFIEKFKIFIEDENIAFSCLDSKI